MDFLLHDIYYLAPTCISNSSKIQKLLLFVCLIVCFCFYWLRYQAWLLFPELPYQIDNTANRALEITSLPISNCLFPFSISHPKPRKTKAINILPRLLQNSGCDFFTFQIDFSYSPLQKKPRILVCKTTQEGNESWQKATSFSS